MMLPTDVALAAVLNNLASCGGLGFAVLSLRFGVWGVGFGGQGLGFEGWG